MSHCYRYTSNLYHALCFAPNLSIAAIDASVTIVRSSDAGGEAKRMTPVSQRGRSVFVETRVAPSVYANWPSGADTSSGLPIKPRI